MKKIIDKIKNHKVVALAAIISLLFASCSYAVYKNSIESSCDKALSAYVNDIYDGVPIELLSGTSVSQEFTSSENIHAVGSVFYNSDRASGTVICQLSDAKTGESLASSSRPVSELTPNQYSMFPFESEVDCSDRVLSVEFSADCSDENPVSIACSDAHTINHMLKIDDTPADATLALKVSYDRIGTFAIAMFTVLSAVLTVFIGVIFYLHKKEKLPAHRFYFISVFVLCLVYCFVLPPYSAPDEAFHINQSFNNTSVVLNGVERSNIVWGDNYKRPSDTNSIVENKNTTVFTYREIADNFFSTSPDSASETQHFAQEEVGGFNLLYLFSSLGVLLGRILHFGFVPTLFLGRLFNIVFYALVTSLAIKLTPVGKSVFAAVCLLPMNIHIAASFSRDCVLLGIAVLLTAYCLYLKYDDSSEKITPKQLVILGLLCALLSPSKLVYFPLCFLFLIIPASKFTSAKSSKLVKIALSAVVVFSNLLLSSNIISALLSSVTSLSAQTATQAAVSSVAVNPDYITYNLSYILSHLKDAVLIFINTFVENTSFYIKSLIGGSLGYYSLDLDWIWTAGFGFLLALSVFDSKDRAVLSRRDKAVGWVIVLSVFAMIMYSVFQWTPTYYTEIYGLQGRYFMPIIPLALLCLQRKSVSLTKSLTSELIWSCSALHCFTVLNIFLVILSR
ncbi:MAG: DUF2142 domain-containing protein [Oscillospiraceae bacterium]